MRGKPTELTPALRFVTFSAEFEELLAAYPRAARAALAQMQEMRLRAEAHELDRQLKLAQIERLQALDDQADAAVGGTVWWPSYPLGPVADGRKGHCRGGPCGGKPGGGSGPKPHAPRQRGISFR